MTRAPAARAEMNQEDRGAAMSGRLWIAVGSVVAGLAVAAGAFAAHGLKPMLSAATTESWKPLEIVETAARYHMYHGLALVVLGVVAIRLPKTVLLGVIGWSWLLGVALFSGSLYAMALSGVRWLGAITPLGGVAFLIGWGTLAFAAARDGIDQRGEVDV